MKVWLGGASIVLAKLTPLGQGGEADVYDLGDGRALKIYKAPDHPENAGVPGLEQAARQRLHDAAAKLRDFPRGLPPHVVKPQELATRTRRPDDVIGYAMAKVDGDPLHCLCEPHWRRANPTPAERVIAVLRDLHVTLDAVHRAGVVIGDFNDTNVLVAGERAWLIDADSWQYGRWRSTMFTQRFLDPRLCPPDPDTAWYAFAVMLTRALLWVDPYGGVHPKVRQTRRAAERVSIFDADVVYPKAANPWRILPDDLVEHLRAVFEHDRRGRFPADLLDRLRLRTPGAAVAVPPSVVRGRVRAQPIDPATLAPKPPGVWIDGAMLMRAGTFGPEPIGQVLAGATRVWASDRLGVGLWRAGGYTQCFVFRPDRRGLRDGIAIPRIRGAVLDVHGVCAQDRAWLWWREALAGRETYHCVAIGAAGDLLGIAEAPHDDAGWLASLRGACAVGAHLFVPTDAGIVRVEAQSGALAETRSFPDTAEFVTAADVLHPAPAGLDVRTRDGALRLTLT